MHANRNARPHARPRVRGGAPRPGVARLAAVLAGMLLVCGADAGERPALPARLAARLDVRALQGASVAAAVVRLDDGAVLFARHADRALVPASNQKLLTALAALDTFGPAHRFTTEVRADRTPDGDGAVGTLYVRGGGDPTLTSEECWRLAADLRREGLRAVEGDLVLDAGVFDGEYWNPAWAPVSARAYHAPVAGLSANYGAFALVARPVGGPGTVLHAAIDPPVPYLQLVNRARAGPRRRGPALVFERARHAGGERVLLGGTLPAGGEPDVLHRSVADPVGYFGAVLRMQLEAVGIRVKGGTREGGVPDGTVALKAYEGRPLAEVVRLLMKYSNNAIAESLVKAMGHAVSGAPGSWGNGIPALRERLVKLGVDLEGAVLADGSGLAITNRLSPRTLVSVLRAGDGAFRLTPEYVGALPIGGTDGTLERRVATAGARVRAKTGFLTGAVGLSGYARLADGDQAAFSILVNGYRGGDRAAMRAVDRFVAALVE